jgi:hypothetical protein
MTGRYRANCIIPWTGPYVPVILRCCDPALLNVVVTVASQWIRTFATALR